MGRAAATAASVLGRPPSGHARREAEDGPACVIRSHQAAVCSLAISEELGLVLSADVGGRCLLHRAPSGVCVGEPWTGGGTRRPVATALSRCSGHLAVAFTDVTSSNGVDVLSVGGHLCRRLRLGARPVHVDFGRQDLNLLIATEDEVRGLAACVILVCRDAAPPAPRAGPAHAPCRRRGGCRRGGSVEGARPGDGGRDAPGPERLRGRPRQRQGGGPRAGAVAAFVPHRRPCVGAGASQQETRWALLPWGMMRGRGNMGQVRPP